MTRPQDVVKPEDSIANAAQLGFVPVRIERLRDLLRTELEMAALDAAGIDNTEAYGEAAWQACGELQKESDERVGELHAWALGDGDKGT